MQNRGVTRKLLTAAILTLATAGAAACQTSGTPVPANSSAPAPSTDAPAATEIVNVVAVVDGQPANGYRDTTPADADYEVSMCDASPAGVDSGIFRCSPSAANADACWPSASATLLCINDPWQQELHRVTVADALPADPPVASPIPLAVLLDDGTQCRIRSGGAWGGRDDGLVGAYGCDSDDVILMSTEDGAEPFDRSQPLWTAEVGPLGAGAPHFPPPQSRTVTTAWFAATSPHD